MHSRGDGAVFEGFDCAGGVMGRHEDLGGAGALGQKGDFCRAESFLDDHGVRVGREERRDWNPVRHRG